MSKVKIIALVIVVAIIGLLAWMKLADRLETGQSPAGTEIQADSPVGQPAETGPAITGEESLEDQADALIESMVGEYGEIESAAGDGSAEADVDSSSDSEIFNVDYYAE